MKNISQLFIKNRKKIIKNWLNDEEIEEVFSSSKMSKKSFKKEYADAIFNFFIDSLIDKQNIEDINYIDEFLNKLDALRLDISLSFTICMTLRRSIVEFMFQCKDVSKKTKIEAFNRMNTLFNKKVTNLLRHHLNLIYEEQTSIKDGYKELMNKTKLLEEYKKVVDESTILSKTNPKGIITYANSKFCEISGYSTDELIGKNHNIVRHPDMPKEAFAELWSTIKAKNMWRGIVKNRAKDGHTYIVDATIIPITDASGEIVEYIGLRKDLTEHIEKEEQEKAQIEKNLQDLQQASLQAIDSVLTAIPIPSVILDDDSIIQNYNREFLYLFDIEEKSEQINKLKNRELNFSDILIKDNGYLYCDEIFSWRDNLTGNRKEDLIKVDSFGRHSIFEISVRTIVLNSVKETMVCLNPNDCP
jgi:PAS domain S-box-containing protein